ncbi:MAG TPA: TRAP transporter large permease subunit [Alphaproteobacteria bacterium]|nr:TRAP transporter large permease subunit [Alphaproteobacteria bacterium]
MDSVLLGEILSLVMFAVACGVLMLGFPVAFTLGGVALAFAALGAELGVFKWQLLSALPSRYFGVMTNELLVAVPLFIFMGVVLERAKIAENLLQTIGLCFGRLRGGLALAVVIVGMLLAASTGVVGATVVTMGLLSLPAMRQAGYDPKLACGTICAAGTLGQIIPPSIVLILLGDILQGAYTQAQMELGNFAPEPVSVVDLFAGALIPGVLLVFAYMAWIIFIAWRKPASAPALTAAEDDMALGLRLLKAMLAPALLIVSVLGAIFAGVATPTEGAAFGAAGAMIIAACQKQMNMPMLRHVMRETTKISAMVFVILLGASVFSLVFRGLGGENIVKEALHALPGGALGAMIVVMLMMFVMGFFLDFIEIIFIVVPIVGPVLLMMGLDPVWLGVMIAINLQTSFLTPPFGFALFYLRGVVPADIPTTAIYRGVIPFIAIQLGMLVLVAVFPELVTALPQKMK